MKSLRQIINCTLIAIAAILWITWFVQIFPLMLTSGAVLAFTGIALLALSAIVPGVLLVAYIKGKTKKEAST